MNELFNEENQEQEQIQENLADEMGFDNDDDDIDTNQIIDNGVIYQNGNTIHYYAGALDSDRTNNDDAGGENKE